MFGILDTVFSILAPRRRQCHPPPTPRYSDDEDLPLAPEWFFDHEFYELYPLVYEQMSSRYRRDENGELIRKRKRLFDDDETDIDRTRKRVKFVVSSINSDPVDDSAPVQAEANGDERFTRRDLHRLFKHMKEEYLLDSSDNETPEASKSRKRVKTDLVDTGLLEEDSGYWADASTDTTAQCGEDTLENADVSVIPDGESPDVIEENVSDSSESVELDASDEHETEKTKMLVDMDLDIEEEPESEDEITGDEDEQPAAANGSDHESGEETSDEKSSDEEQNSEEQVEEAETSETDEDSGIGLEDFEEGSETDDEAAGEIEGVETEDVEQEEVEGRLSDTEQSLHIVEEESKDDEEERAEMDDGKEEAEEVDSSERHVDTPIAKLTPKQRTGITRRERWPQMATIHE